MNACMDTCTDTRVSGMNEHVHMNAKVRGMNMTHGRVLTLYTTSCQQLHRQHRAECCSNQRSEGLAAMNPYCFYAVSLDFCTRNQMRGSQPHHQYSRPACLFPCLLLLLQGHQAQRPPLSRRLLSALGRRWCVKGGDACLPASQERAYVLLNRSCDSCSCCCCCCRTCVCCPLRCVLLLLLCLPKLLLLLLKLLSAGYKR